MAQILITLPNGDQVGIMTATTDIDADNTSVRIRKGPKDCWTLPLETKTPHAANGVHFGEW